MRQATEPDLIGERPCQAAQAHKDGLRHVFRPMRVALNQPERISLLTGVAIALILVAITTVYFRHTTAGGFE